MKNGDKFSKSSSQEKVEGLFTADEIKLSDTTDKENLRPVTPARVSGDLIEKLNEIVQLMLSENITEIDIKDGGFSIYVKRRSSRSDLSLTKQVPVLSSDGAVMLVNGAISASSNNGAGGVSNNNNKVDEFAGKRRITSPINGVFYRASSPKSPPFVSEGDVVETGKTLCIIEAMKVMNEIKADSRMKILKILVENGKSVTQGEQIFIVE